MGCGEEHGTAGDGCGIDVEAVVAGVDQAMSMLSSGRPVAEVRDQLGRVLVTLGVAREKKWSLSYMLAMGGH